MASLLRSAIVGVAGAALMACSGQGGTTPSTTDAPPPSSHATSAAHPGSARSGSATSALGVPTSNELAAHLVAPADLGPDWSLWEGFAAWPNGVPGIIPDDQRSVLPALPICPQAGEGAVTQAEGLGWQVFTQLHRATPDPFANMVVVQQFMLANEPATTTAIFATLRDGLTSCLTANRPGGDWEIGLREALVVPEVGDERYAERSSSVDAGGARRDTRLVLVRDGAILMVIQLDDVLIRPGAEPLLTTGQVDAIVRVAAGRLP